MTQPDPIVRAGAVSFANDAPVSFILGPCQMQSRDHALLMADRIKTIANNLGVQAVFKASDDKANRTSLSSSRGIGLEKASSDGPNIVPLSELE